jgi:hypothetical protein
MGRRATLHASALPAPGREQAPRLSPELRLLTACARWPRDEARAHALRDAARMSIDWPVFVEIVRRHRMAAMALDGLRQADIALPDATVVALRAQAGTDTRQILATVAEAAAIDSLATASGETYAVVKGPAMAKLAYGDIALRQCRDLDVLMDLDAALRFRTTLIAAGYRQLAPQNIVHEAGLRRWLRFQKDFTLFSPRTGALVELHTRLMNNPHLLAPDFGSTGRQRVAIGGGITVPTLGDDDQLLYLCVHGAHHGWMRLKWLADIAALLERRGAGEIERLHAVARQRGLHIPFGQALLLCKRLLDTPLPPALTARLHRSVRVRLLERIALRLLTEPREVVQLRFGTTLLVVSQSLLRTGARFWGTEAAQSLVDCTLLESLGGSRNALALAILLRPFAWIWRRTGLHWFDRAPLTSTAKA